MAQLTEPQELAQLIQRSRNPQGNTPLLQAVKDNNLAAVTAIVTSNQKNPLYAARDSTGNTALRIAIDKGLTAIKNKINEQFAIQKKYANSPVANKVVEAAEAAAAAAAASKRTKEAEAIAKMKAEEAAKAALAKQQEEYLASRKAAEDAAKKYTEEVHATNAQGNTTLQQAVLSGDADAVQALIDSGDDLIYDQRNGDGFTALQLAIKNGRADIANAIIASGGGDPNQTSNDGSRALHFAAAQGMSDVIDNLLNTPGIEVNIANNDGNTPLHVVKNADVMQHILDAPAGAPPIDPKNKQGNTPLHFAAMLGKSDVVSLLIDNGANKAAKNNAKKTPLDVASEDVKGLLQAGGRRSKSRKSKARKTARKSKARKTARKSKARKAVRKSTKARR